jgi:DNA polymerase (family 10)
LPGIGKDLAKKIRELADSGTCRFHQDLLLEFPPTILDLLRVQGVGPKTVALLYSALNIRTLDDLAAAAREGRLRELRGMGTKKEALILKALEERQ